MPLTPEQTKRLALVRRAADATKRELHPTTREEWEWTKVVLDLLGIIDALQADLSTVHVPSVFGSPAPPTETGVTITYPPHTIVTTGGHACTCTLCMGERGQLAIPRGVSDA